MYTDSTSIPLYIFIKPETYYMYLDVGTGKKCKFASITKDNFILVFHCYIVGHYVPS